MRWIPSAAAINEGRWSMIFSQHVHDACSDAGVLASHCQVNPLYFPLVLLPLVLFSSSTIFNALNITVTILCTPCGQFCLSTTAATYFLFSCISNWTNTRSWLSYCVSLFPLDGGVLWLLGSHRIPSHHREQKHLLSLTILKWTVLDAIVSWSHHKQTLLKKSLMPVLKLSNHYRLQCSMGQRIKPLKCNE